MTNRLEHKGNLKQWLENSTVHAGKGSVSKERVGGSHYVLYIVLLLEFHIYYVAVHTNILVYCFVLFFFWEINM